MMISEALQHALWCAANWNDLQGEYPECDKCPYRPADQAYCDEMDAIIVDAYKALTPRVMTIDEVDEALCDSVYVEECGEEIRAAIVGGERNKEEILFVFAEWPDVYMYRSDYGKLWRCWTLRPTEAQREAAKWR